MYDKAYAKWRAQTVDKTEWQDIINILRSKFPKAKTILVSSKNSIIKYMFFLL